MENQFRYLGEAHIVTLGPELSYIYIFIHTVRYNSHEDTRWGAWTMQMASNNRDTATIFFKYQTQDCLRRLNMNLRS